MSGGCQGGQHREEHSVDHYVQVEHYQGQFEMVWFRLNPQVPLSVAKVSKVKVDLEGKNKG